MMERHVNLLLGTFVIMMLLIGSTPLMVSRPSTSGTNDKPGTDPERAIVVLTQYNGFSGYREQWTLIGDGTVTHAKEERHDVTSVSIYTVPQDWVRKVLSAMERTGFYGLNDSYESCGFDCGGTSILVKTDNVTKSVSVGGCTCEPVPGFTEVVTMIREAVADPISR